VYLLRVRQSVGTELPSLVPRVGTEESGWVRASYVFSCANMTKCVVPAGANECTQCKRSGIECIIRNDDERRR
jgi:hypothetical protein